MSAASSNLPRRTAGRAPDRRHVALTGTVGAVGVALVLLAEAVGILAPAERLAYDGRARFFQFFNPPPSDRILHLDIDDRSLDAIGRWPWSRGELAQLLEEVSRARPRVIGLDITFPDPAQDAAEDEALAGTIRRLRNVLIPVNFAFDPPQHLPAWHRQIFAILSQDLTTDLEDLPERLRDDDVAPPDSVEALNNAFFAARREVVYRRLDALLQERDLTLGEALEVLVPGQSRFVRTPLVRVIEQQYQRARSIRTLERFTGRTAPFPPLLKATDHQAPIPPVGAAAAMSGFVDYVADPGGVVRSVPLLVEYEGRVYTQMALALTCLALGVDVNSLRTERHAVVIPESTGSPAIAIPTRRVRSGVYGDYATVMDVPWFGPPNAGWVNMYDRDSSDARRQHLPIATVWEALRLRQSIRDNLGAVDRAVMTVYAVFDPAAGERFAGHIAGSEDSELRIAEIRAILGNADISREMQHLAQAHRDGERLDEEYLLLLDRYELLEQMPVVLAGQEQLVTDAEDLQRLLLREMEDKIVLVGFTATSLVQADLKPTSLHALCPGVVAHGTIINGLLTGEMWTRAPHAAGAILITVAGLGVTAAVALLSPIWATALAGLLLIGYTLVNTLVLFDYANLIVPLAGPLATIGVVWAACTAHRYIDERRSRARITARFRSYVDPVLVDYVIGHPDQTSLAGETRELTVVFTDLAGFTTLSEKLKGRTVPLLNEYMGLMVPVIRGHGGYVNKFLGDGIMFFFGAPLPNPHHARDAAATVWRMQEVARQFSARLTERGLPPVSMRAGVLTGEVVVGDAGSLAAARPEDRASDYTVLGDNVNLASRLEGANKATGTLVLLAERTVQLLNGEFLVRPIARLQVVGKSEGVMTYEPVAPADAATDEHRKLVEMTSTMVGHYAAARWSECLAAAEALEAAFGPAKLTALYRQACRTCMVAPPADFMGQIVLTEK